MKPTFIVEGMDGCGKSTLAASLSKVFNFNIIESGGPPKDLGDLAKWCKWQYDLAAIGGVVLDRVSCISQRCYNKNIDVWTEKFLVHQARELLDNTDSILIHCRPPDDVVLSLSNHKVTDRDSDELIEFIKSNTQFILSQYDLIMSCEAHYKFDYINGSIEEFISQIRLCESM